MAQIIIHRGAKQIGGCVTEIESNGSRVFIDIGDNLPGNDSKLHSISGLTSGNGYYEIDEAAHGVKKAFFNATWV